MCFHGLIFGGPLNIQKFVFIPLLVFGCLIYIYLLYGFIWHEKRVRYDFYVSSAFNIHSKSNSGNITRIIALGTNTFKSAPLFCRHENGQAIKAQIVEMGGPAQCAWWNYFIDCQFDESTQKVTLFGATADEIDMNVRVPENKHYKFVVCYSRMFYYENWQIALLSIEMYRKYGVELFSIPIISVIKELYIILQHYQSHGIVKLRKGRILPTIPELDYNPNHETEFFNQMISATECLYEYRSSEFILFADLDDLIIPRKFETLYDELTALSQQFPLASSFEFKWTRYNVEMTKNPNNFNIEKTISRIQFKSSTDVGKTVAIPSRINNGIMHRPYSTRDIDSNYTHIILSQNDTLTIHLREQFDSFEESSDLAYFQYHDFSGTTQRLHDFLASNETTFKSLPTRQTYFPLMVSCYLNIGRRLKNGKQTKCPNPLHCNPYKESRKDCMILKSRFESIYIGAGLTVHIDTNSELIESQSCSIREINA